MKLTNLNNYPAALVKAIENDPYTKGDSDYSVTDLLTPPRIKRLKEIHFNEISEDVEDRIYSLLGQAVHSIIERANTNDLVEKRFFCTINDKKISAQVDNLNLINGTLSDYKVTTCWKLKKNSPIDPNWSGQLNIQKYILKLNGIDVKKLEIVGIVRDFRKKEALQYPDSYPDKQIVIVNVPIWEDDKVESFIKLRIALHESAKKELPECDPSERWEKQTTWAVIKGKRAIRGGIHLSEESAILMKNKNQGTSVEKRPGESTRCSLYCVCSKFCDQFKRIKSEMDSNENNMETYF